MRGRAITSVLVTGGAGYIGSHMTLDLLDAGERVIVLDNLSAGHEWTVERRAIFVKGDASDIHLVTAFWVEHGIIDILHFAGSIVVPEAIENRLKYYGKNTSASRNLIEGAVKSDLKNVIFSSTAAVYGMPGATPVGEEAPLPPLSPYGSSKLMTEMMLADVAAANDLRFGALRYFNVAGAGPHERAGQSTLVATHLIQVACQAALGLRRSFETFGTDCLVPDATCVRDYVHVSDIVRALSLVLSHLRAGGENLTLNCGYGHGISVYEVVEAVRKVSGIEFEVRKAGRRPGDPAAIVAKADRIRNLLGWQPENNSLEEIVRSAWQWGSVYATARPPGRRCVLLVDSCQTRVAQ